MGYAGIPPPPGFEEVEQPAAEASSGAPPPPPGFEEIPEEEEGKPLFAGRKVGEEPETSGGNVFATAARFYGLPGPGSRSLAGGPVPAAAPAPAPQLPTPLPQGQVSRYQAPRPKGPSWDPSIATPLPQMESTELPNEPVISNVEAVWKHAPGPRGPNLIEASKAALRATPKDVSAFQGVPAGQPVTTRPGGPQTLAEAAGKFMGPEWQRTAEDIYGTTGAKVLRGTGTAVASFEDAMGSATNLGLIGGLGAVAKIATLKWGPEVGKNISRLVDAKFAADIGGSLATDRARELGEAIESKDPEKMANAAAGAILDFSLLAHPARKPAELGGGVTLGGIIPNMIEGVTPGGQRRIALEQQGARRAAEAPALFPGQPEAQKFLGRLGRPETAAPPPGTRGLSAERGTPLDWTKGTEVPALGTPLHDAMLEGGRVDTTGTPLEQVTAKLGPEPPKLPPPPPGFEEVPEPPSQTAAPGPILEPGEGQPPEAAAGAPVAPAAAEAGAGDRGPVGPEVQRTSEPQGPGGLRRGPGDVPVGPRGPLPTAGQLFPLDEQDTPLTLYRGEGGGEGIGSHLAGSHWATDRSYAALHSADGVVREAHLDLQNPFDMRVEENVLHHRVLRDDYLAGLGRAPTDGDYGDAILHAKDQLARDGYDSFRYDVFSPEAKGNVPAWSVFDQKQIREAPKATEKKGEPVPEEVARRADELKAQFEAENHARRGPLKERAALRAAPPTDEEFRLAAKEIADEQAAEPQREPRERAENAEAVGRPQDQEHGEAADTGERLPEPEPAGEGAGRAEPAPGGRGERGTEAPADLTPEGWTHERAQLANMRVYGSTVDRGEFDRWTKELEPGGTTADITKIPGRGYVADAVGYSNAGHPTLEGAVAGIEKHLAERKAETELRARASEILGGVPSKFTRSRILALKDAGFSERDATRMAHLARAGVLAIPKKAERQKFLEEQEEKRMREVQERRGAAPPAEDPVKRAVAEAIKTAGQDRWTENPIKMRLVANAAYKSLGTGADRAALARAVEEAARAKDGREAAGADTGEANNAVVKSYVAKRAEERRGWADAGLGKAGLPPLGDIIVKNLRGGAETRIAGEGTLPSASALTQKSSKADVEKTLAEARKQGEIARHVEALRRNVALYKSRGDDAITFDEFDKRQRDLWDAVPPGLHEAVTRGLVGEKAPEMAPPPPEGYIGEGEQNAAPREPADQGGPHGEGAVEEARAEAVRGPGEEREALRDLAQGTGTGRGAVRPNDRPGGQPARGAEGGLQQPPEVRPGERPGEGAALGGGRGAGQRGTGNEETPITAGTERPKGPAEPERAEVPEGEITLESHPTSSNSGRDFRYASPADAEVAAAGGARSRVAANIEALRVLEAVKAAGRLATAAEQAALAKFSGWGSFPGLFRPGSDLEDQGDIVRKLIGEDAWEAARASTLNAHYTAPQIVSAMWDAAKRLGLRGGRILEPSLGIGNFFALMPPEIRGRSQLTGVELDTSTGEMAKILYPNANVEVKGFQDLKVPDGFYDFAISNVPFGDYRVHDKEYNKYPANIHDYFFLKSLDKVRPGGVVAFITSTGTMDKNATRVREAMIEKGADLVAAIRLPGETFQKTAGTSVVTDIIFLKKRAPGEPPSGHEWTKTVEFPDPDGKAPIPLNEYFAANPQQVLGRLDRSGTMYRGEQVNVKRLPDFEEKFRAAIERLPEKIIEPRKASSAFDPKLVQSAGNAKYGSSVVQNGKLYVSLGDVMREVAADPATVTRVEKMLAIRDQVRDLYDAQLSGKGDAAVQGARQKLGKLYDAFVQKHGPISSAPNRKPIWDDPDTPYILQSLERVDPKTKKVTKTDIFTKDTVASYRKAEHATSAGDAVSISLRERGNVDIGEMAKLLGRTEAEVGKDLVSEGLAYDDPKDGWTAKSLYLSGNVRRKLLEAKAAAKVDPRYAANLEPLEQAQPKDLDFTEIYAPVGAPWIPEGDHVDFMQHLIGGQPHDFRADYDPTHGHWYFKYTDRGRRHQGLAPDTKLWGTDRLGFMKLMESAANGQHPAVREPHPTEENRTVVNVEATAAANQKVDDIKRAFEDWVWDDPERRTRLHRYYNDNFNNLKRTDYDASHYKDAEGNYHFPGMNPAISMRPHQANFVWQGVSTGRGLAGHEVGTGKTMVEAAIAMEWRRLGLSRKPIITVPDSVIAGFADEFRNLYPAARIIVTGSGLDAKERKETLARAASGDWDAVLMTHDNLDKLTMRPEVTQAYIKEQLDELRAVKLAAHEKDPKKDNRIVKALEKAELRLETKLQDLIEGKTEKDRALYFEELGGDSLIVDEAHVYKSLPVYTAMENLKGVPGQESQRATNMLMRTRWLQEQNGGRGVVFATGTPIDNSLAELYNMQRYLQFNELKERGIQSFDAWARTFATEQSQMEMKATGDYAMETRLSSFVNVPDLQALSGVVTDVKRAADMGDIIRPHRTDELVTVPMSDLGRQYLDVLRRRAEAIRKRGRLEKGEHGDTFLAITNDAAEAATDIRRVAPGAPDEPGSKVNALVRKVLEIHEENPGKTQLIFSDRGVHETLRGGHSTYKDIIRKLVKGGIPAAKIINFSDLGKGGKEEAVARVKSGDALVAIGGSKTLGTGVNLQDKLIAVHHLDCPWTPARLEQRNGRIWRQGNENTHIRIIPYVTEGSFDANMWEAVNRKSKFIAQFMDGKFKGRSFEDPDAEKLSYAQIMAKASGSPELLEKINLEEQVKKLERAKRQHKKIQAELQDSLATSANMADYHRNRIAIWEAAAQRLATPRGKFSVEVGGKVYDDPIEAGKAMEAIYGAATKAAHDYGPGAPIPLATYRGEPIVYSPKDFAVTAFDGTKQLSMEVGRWESLLNSFDGVTRSLPAYIAQEKASLAAVEAAAEKAKAEIGKPFRDEEKLAAGQKRLPELEQIVKQKMEAAKKAREGQTVDPLLAGELSRTMVHPEAPEAAPGEKALNPKAFYTFNEQTGYREAKGRKLDIPENPDHDFFLHKNHHGAWVVSEARSGLGLGVAENTQLAATAAARRKIAATPPGKLNELIAEHVEKHGPSPRFPTEYKAFQEAQPAEPSGEPEPMVKGEDGVYRAPEKPEPKEAAFNAPPQVAEQDFRALGGKRNYGESTRDENFRRWFGKSKVVNDQGKPLVVYHGTDAEDDFSKFEFTQDVGFHFGTAGAANSRLAQIDASEHARIIPAYLSLKNPLRLPDMETWGPMKVVSALRDAWILSPKEVRKISDEGYFDEEDFRRALESKGYDGVVYKNATEGGGDSYIALRPEQIKSATGNRGAFGPTDTSIQDFRAPAKAFSARPKEREAEPEPIAPGAPPPRTPLRELKPTILAPVFDPKVAKRLGQVTMRATLADMARRHDIEATAMTDWDKHFDTPRRMETPAHIEEIARDWETKGKKAEAKALREHAEQLDFIDRVERGAKQESPDKQGLADYLERAWDARKEELIALGKEAARSWHLDYFPHIWNDPAGIRDRIRAILGPRPLEGQKGFEKHRTFLTTMDGLRAGYVPVDWNPVRLSLLKMSEMDRAITARRFLQDLDRLGMKKYVGNGQQIAGWRVPKDNAFQVWKSGDVEVKEAFDKKLMDQLQGFADSLGVKVSTKRALGKGRWGVSNEGEIGRRFGGPEFVVTHELGHQLDKRFGLYDKLSKIDGVDHELQELSNYRIGEDTDAPMGEIQDFQKYARTPDEMTANLVHALIHTPELARRVAPKAIKALRELAMKDKDLRPLLSIKPSLELGEASTTYSAGGPVKTGAWAVPEPIADLLDRHLSPSLLAGSNAFDAYRKTSQALLMARLGWSAFHLGFTTADATISRVALAGTYASQGNVGEALKSLANIPKVATGWFSDNPILKEWYRPGTQGADIGAIVKALEMGGARARQADLYNLGAYEGFFRDLRREGTLKATLGHPVRNGAALIEAGSRYVLNSIVPRQKLAIAAEMARRELLRFQEETGAKSFAEALRLTNPERVKDIMGRVVDSIDNRMGQLIYDNLFMNRTLRDALHATVQSVGWNLGTWRELGGGIHDIKYLFKPDVDVTGKALPRVSDRLAYTLALPFCHALISTAIQYAYTGERPKDMHDLIFPRNGRMNPDGSPSRLSPATYMKDVWAYLGGFSRGGWHGIGQAAQTVMHKMNPMLSMLTELARNEDFFGTEVIDKNAPVATQLMDVARFLGKSTLPYSFQGFMKERRSGASALEAAPAFFGLVPAAASVSRSPAQQALVEYQRAHLPRAPRTHAQAEYSDLRNTMVHAQRAGDTEGFAEAAKEAQDKGVMSRREILKLGRSTASTAMENKFKGLPLDEATRVYEMASPEEKTSFGPIFKRKIAGRTGLAHVPLADRVGIVKKAQAALQGVR